MADSATTLQDVGSGSSKKTLAILGDGFAAGADQTTYNNYVRDEVMDGVFLSDAFNEDSASWNIIRINLESANSPASTRTWNDQGTPTDISDDTATDNILNTALNIISNGSWWHGWFEDSTDTRTRINDAVNKWAPGADFKLVVVNSALEGGLRTDSILRVTLAEPASTIAHEFGHGFGDLGDEYSADDKGAYTDDEPKPVNNTIETDRSKIKWRQFIDPATPIPTGTGADSGYTAGTPPAGWDNTNDAGLFEGAGTWETGMHRPTVDCWMRHNTPGFCPVCYTEMKRVHHSATGRTFRTIVPGRFTGATRSEFFGIDEFGISLYRCDGSRWEHVRTTPGTIRGGWEIRNGDKFVAGDFDGDGRDELAVFNGKYWSIPYLGLLKVRTDGSVRLLARYDGDIAGWGGFAGNDQFLVGDFDGDGRDDLLALNMRDWSMPYAATLRSTGTGFTLTRRYDGDIPGWGGMREHDQFSVARVGGGARSDIVGWNSRDWSSIYLGLIRPGRSGGLQCIRLWEDDLPGWGGFAKNDRIYVGDFNADGRDDLYLFNGRDWSSPYLGMFRSTGSNFVAVQLYEDDVPGWGGMAKNDQFLPVDLTGNGRIGLFAWNMVDWGPNYAGRMVSSGNALTADFREEWVGEWHLGLVDRFSVALPRLRKLVIDPGFHSTALGRGLDSLLDELVPGSIRTERGVRVVQPRTADLGVIIVAAGPDRVIAHNSQWLGTFSTDAPLTLDNIYYRWIHNYRYGRNW